MATKAELQEQIDQLKAQKGDEQMRRALEAIKAKGGVQGAMAADALKG